MLIYTTGQILHLGAQGGVLGVGQPTADVLPVKRDLAGGGVVQLRRANTTMRGIFVL